ncbi:MAG: lysophospholipid acyltransferase family protein [Gemmataceae bacterium]
MKLRNPRLIRWLAFAFAGVLRAWLATLRYRIVWADGRPHPRPADSGHYLYALWHESLLVPAFVRMKLFALISRHTDGEFIAQVCGFLGYGVVRGSTTRGGAAALHELMQAARAGSLLVTPDGPRGPRRKVQSGLVYLSSRTGLPIVFIAVGFARAWRARSWDRFAAPWPGSTVCVIVSAARPMPAALDRPAQERHRRGLEREFLQLTAAAEAWAAGGSRPAFAAQEMHGHRQCA